VLHQHLIAPLHGTDDHFLALPDVTELGPLERIGYPMASTLLETVRATANVFCFTEHARLKDHVASMEGGLEAKINEGG
jgi:hypothetical protein